MFKTTINTLVLLLLCAITNSCSAQKRTTQQDPNTHLALQKIEDNSSSYQSIAKQIWSFAELGYQEEKSAALLKSTLQKEGFKIESGVAEIPTAFIASYGSGHPVIAILGEYDALPGVSQDAVPERKEVTPGGAGHACGHHLFGTGSAAATIAVKTWLQKANTSGTIRFYGTPAEEGGAGKVYMVREGLFDDVDAVLHWHPSSSNGASAASSLANKSAKFRFRGIASHAAAFSTEWTLCFGWCRSDELHG